MSKRVYANTSVKELSDMLSRAKEKYMSLEALLQRAKINDCLDGHLKAANLDITKGDDSDGV